MSCSTTNKFVSKLPINRELPNNISFSNEFRSFWVMFVEEVNKVSSIDKYVPSDDILTFYSLSNDNGVYYLSGYLSVNNDFDLIMFEKKGGELVKFSDTLYTFRFPLKNITSMFDVKGITAVEITNKVQLIK